MSSWRGAALVLVGATAALFYSNFLLDVVFSPQHDWFAVVSELEVAGAPTATLLRTTDVLCGMLTLCLLPFVRAGLPAGRARGWAIWLMVTFAVTGALAGIVPLPAEPATGTAAEVQRLAHDGFSIVSQTAVFLAAVAVGVATRSPHGPRWLHRAAWATFWLGGVLGTVLFGAFAALDSTSWQTGVAQRFQLGVTSAWLVCLGVLAATSGLRAEDRSLDGSGADIDGLPEGSR
jgi:hypothetical protein